MVLPPTLPLLGLLSFTPSQLQTATELTLSPASILSHPIPHYCRYVHLVPSAQGSEGGILSCA